MRGLATWIGAISTAAASMIALWLGLRDGRRRIEERDSDARALIAFLSRDLVVIKNRLNDLIHRGEDMDCGRRGFTHEDLNEMSQWAFALKAPRLREHADRFSVLPEPVGVHLSAAVAKLDAIESMTLEIAENIRTTPPEDLHRYLSVWGSEIIEALIDLKPALQYWDQIKDSPPGSSSMLKRCLRIIRRRQGS
jgi:hypothetical protein